MYQLCLGEETVVSFIDRITARACAVAPALDPGACRRLIELIVRARLRRTVACGSDHACHPDGLVLGLGTSPREVTAQWLDLDPAALPEMFAGSAIDLLGDAAGEDATLAPRLAAAFRDILRPALFRNPRCGRARVCGGEPLFDPLGE